MYGDGNEKTNGELYLYRFLEPKCAVIFDVGLGESPYYTLEESVSYHLFEAYPPYFSKNFEKYGGMSNVKVNLLALGSEKTELPFYYKYGMSFVKRADFATTDIVIKTDTLDNYIEENNVDKIDFLKIDTEGWEFPIIKGAERSLSKISHIQFEYGGTWPEGGFKIKEAYDFLGQHGFENFIITPDGVTRIPDLSDHGRYCNYFSTRKIDDIKEIIR